MASSLLNSSNSGSTFNISIPSKYTSVILTQTYAAGAYSFTSVNGSSNMDVYFLNTSTGTTVGYTSTKAITASASFNKIVVLGGSSGDLLQFTFTTTYVASAETSETSAGPVLTGATPTTLANINNSLTLTGLNFNNGMSVTFTGSDLVARSAKSVVVGSPNSAIVTRPDTLPTTYAPYTLTATNPGVNAPVGTNSHILATPTISAGVNPVWGTSGTISSYCFYNNTYSYQLSATDADSGGSITSYALVSGALPAGLSLSSSGLISGTPTNNVSSLTASTFVVSATDSGGNTINSGTLTINQGMTAVTTGLYAFYSATGLTGGQNTWTDLSGNGNTMTFTSAIAASSNTLNFNNGNSGPYGTYSLPYATANANGYVTLEFYTTINSGGGMLWGVSAYDLYMSSGAGINTGSSDTYGITSTVFNNNVGSLHHWVFIIPTSGTVPGRMQIWIDGVQQSVGQQAATTSATIGSSQFNGAASFNNWNGGGYAGSQTVKYFRHYNASLTSAQINQNYQACLNGYR